MPDFRPRVVHWQNANSRFALQATNLRLKRKMAQLQKIGLVLFHQLHAVLVLHFHVLCQQAAINTGHVAPG